MTLDRDSLGSLTVVDVPERCGNAPRKAVVRDFTVALVSKNVAEVLQHISADAQWTLNGKQPLHGADEISAWVAGGPEAQELEIHTVITHGTECGVDGVVTFTDGTAQLFSHIMRFSGGSKTAKIKEVRSYVIAPGH